MGEERAGAVRERGDARGGVVARHAADVEIQLELRLGTARAHDDARAVSEPQPQHVARRQVVDAVLQVVDAIDRDLPDGFRMPRPQRRHDAGDLRHVVDADRDLVAREGAELLLELGEEVGERRAAAARLGHHAQDRDGGRDAVLVAHGAGVHEIAERLLEPEHHAGGAGDPLEAREGRVEAESVVLCDSLQAGGGDQRAGEGGAFGSSAVGRRESRSAPPEEQSDLVAGQPPPPAVGRLVGEGDGQPVGVGIVGDHQLRAGLAGGLEREVHGAGFLGIRERHGREVAVGLELRRHWHRCRIAGRLEDA